VELRDQYGRLLAYVWLEEPKGEADGKQIRDHMFNARLLLDGYVQQMTFPPNVRYVDYFNVYQAEAREAGRGLWGLGSGSKISNPDKTAGIESEYVGNKNSLVFHRPSCDGAAHDEREKPYNHREPRKKLLKKVSSRVRLVYHRPTASKTAKQSGMLQTSVSGYFFLVLRNCIRIS
jgi:hypothetical protein